jgi:hypothetical protein
LRWGVILSRNDRSLCLKRHGMLQKAGRSPYARERKMVYERGRRCGNHLPEFYTATKEGKTLVVVLR